MNININEILLETDKRNGNWKRVKGFENYVISKNAEIINLNTKNKLKYVYNTQGQKTPSIKLYKNRELGLFNIAKLVYETFVRDLEANERLFTRDGDKNNCRLENLIVLRITERTVNRQRDHKVFRIDLKTLEAKRYKSVSQAAIDNLCMQKSLNRALKGVSPMALGYVWRYAEDLPKDTFLLDQLGGLKYVL